MAKRHGQEHKHRRGRGKTRWKGLSYSQKRNISSAWYRAVLERKPELAGRLKQFPGTIPAIAVERRKAGVQPGDLVWYIDKWSSQVDTRHLGIFLDWDPKTNFALIGQTHLLEGEQFRRTELRPVRHHPERLEKAEIIKPPKPGEKPAK
jgi:hypothetical protein